jgi:predicted nucleic acid-binding protein
VSYLIDTNIISEVRKGTRCEPSVAAWYHSILDGDVHLSVLVLGEIRKGAELARPRDAPKARALTSWLAQVEAAFAERILSVDARVADEWGRMNALRPIPIIDGLLAATAKVHGMTFVTRNAADVEGLGVKLLNPFTWTGR